MSETEVKKDEYYRETVNEMMSGDFVHKLNDLNADLFACKDNKDSMDQIFNIDKKLSAVFGLTQVLARQPEAAITMGNTFSVIFSKSITSTISLAEFLYNKEDVEIAQIMALADTTRMIPTLMGQSRSVYVDEEGNTRIEEGMPGMHKNPEPPEQKE